LTANLKAATLGSDFLCHFAQAFFLPEAYVVHFLSENAEQSLVRRDGRRLVRTAAAEQLPAYGRRLLALNDETLTALHGHALAGPVRLGAVGDFADTWMPQTLALFQRGHPQGHLRASVDRPNALCKVLDRVILDLALASSGDGRADATLWRTVSQQWIGPVDTRFRAGEPVDLVVLPAPGRFRQGAIDRLEAAGIPWRIAFSGHSVATLWADVRAGLGATIRMARNLPCGLAALGEPKCARHPRRPSRRRTPDEWPRRAIQGDALHGASRRCRGWR